MSKLRAFFAHALHLGFNHEPRTCVRDGLTHHCGACSMILAEDEQVSSCIFGGCMWAFYGVRCSFYAVYSTLVPTQLACSCQKLCMACHGMPWHVVVLFPEQTCILKYRTCSHGMTVCLLHYVICLALLLCCFVLPLMLLNLATLVLYRNASGSACAR